jgi:hypothetical protein
MLTAVATWVYPRILIATPVRQELARSSSQITFGVESPNPSLRMNGSFEDFRGRFELNPSQITDSTLELTLNLASVSLPPEQLMQALFVQGIIARVAPRPNTFRSSRLEHTSGSSYLLHGSYSWMNKMMSTGAHWIRARKHNQWPAMGYQCAVLPLRNGAVQLSPGVYSFIRTKSFAIYYSEAPKATMLI